MIHRYNFLIVLFLLVASTGCLSSCRSILGISRQTSLEAAESKVKEGDIDAALALYEKHMQVRLGIVDKPNWENPYFYHLIMGDLELKRGNLPSALQNYRLAEEHGVEQGLLSDRYRVVANYLEQKGDIAGALDFLRPLRDRDPLLIDAVLDRLAKELSAQEDLESGELSLSPTPLATR